MPVPGPPPCPYVTKETILRLGGGERLAEQIFEALIMRTRYEIEVHDLRRVVKAWEPHLPREIVASWGQQMITSRAPPESDG